MTLQFPADPSAQTPENTYSPDSTPLASGNGVTYFWDGEKWTASTGTQEDIYLSKITDDTAAGAITFEGKTTHEAGVSVTGGRYFGSSLQSGKSIFVNLPDGTTLSNTNSGLIHSSVNSGVLAENVDAASFLGGSPTTITVPASSSYAAFRSSSQAHSSGNVYSFYAAGSAPNYFAGATLIGGVNTSMDNGAGTEDGWVFSSSGRASSHCTLSTTNDNNASFKMWKHDSRTGRFISFHYSNAIGNGGDSVCGYIVQTSANSVEYEKTSDYRLKENIVDLPNATERVKAIKPYQYNFKNEPGVVHEGFVAHELQEHTVLAVSGEKDATEVFGTYTDVDGNVETNVTEPATIPAGATFEPQGTRDVYQGVAPSALIPLLTKALQEALGRIEVLEAEHAQMMNNGGY